ncbi:MAG: penicillin-binding transpeptidase domain-containing protein [Gammaproteobacteria bacterium]|jgi:cell division protein FtsI (penicillin-binding protein 3)
MMTNDTHTANYTAKDKQRVAFTAVMLAFVTFMLLWRAVDLHVVSKDFLQNQGDARYLREVQIPADRGMIVDRNGEPLAISAPVNSVWANPKELIKARQDWVRLCVVLNIDINDLQQQLASHADKEFMYLKRQVIPDVAQRVKQLNIPGVFLTQENRRYYPAGEVTAHVIGFTNIDDVGQEGVELALDDRLRGTPGSMRVIKNRLGQVVEEVEQVRPPQHGKDVVLTIDRRIQYLAYRELKSAVQKNRATSGSIVILDARNGEILAMVNQPSYNPNNKDELQLDHLRNRAITDVFEPGSTMKPFTIAAALESGKYNPHTIVDTTPGLYRVGHKVIRDHRNYGAINVTTVIQKSSNVGASKIALSIEPRTLWKVFAGAGFGETTGVRFPGESTGLLSDYYGWRKIERATLSYGYGLSVTPLQLARAYTLFAGNGSLQPVTLVRRTSNRRDPSLYYQSEPVVSEQTIKQVRKMMQAVVGDGGTGTRAQVPGYKIAGKTGTVKKSGKGGYLDDSYVSVFVGMAPATRPRLIMAVVVNDPHGEEYYGGAVAAPVFSRVMAGTLRLLDVPPDDLPSLRGTQVALLADAGSGGSHLGETQ